MDSFESLGLAEPLSAALESFGFAGPTPIQALAMPLLLARRDAFLESETGTGKTFAYLAPAFQAIFSAPAQARRGSGEPGILVAAPTQELAVQIGREADKLAKAAGLPLRSAVLLGGTPLDKQAAKLRERPDLVVGTLGRLGDLVSLGKLKLGSLSFLVLDEADRLLAPETAEAAKALVKAAPELCARVLVSATIPERFRAEMRPLLRSPVEPEVAGGSVLSGSIEHWCFYCDGRKRLDFVRKFEAAMKPERCLLFISAAGRVEGAAARLASIGLPIAGIHAGLEKEERRVALERFAAGELRYLMTSDLGARGLDIPAVSHVISLDLPEEPTIYTHRAGRTGRAGATGLSIVLADGVELKRASKIATKGGFVFRCKLLEAGAVYEPSPADFFAAAEAAEEEKKAARIADAGAGERRRPKAPRAFERGPSNLGGRPRDDREPRGARPDGPGLARPSRDRPSGARPADDRRSGRGPAAGPSSQERRPYGPRPSGPRPSGGRPGVGRPSSGRPAGAPRPAGGSSAGRPAKGPYSGGRPGEARRGPKGPPSGTRRPSGSGPRPPRPGAGSRKNDG
ncbi:MAG TPA: DEAD/DEAH box helicase [Spirochaetales bacterium]|nr:DEAD/DEAH box helicase [Spirochaetales bacterium]HRY54711.1 DEAD/DEAH box helicase [Spirochaetia bacterium]